MKHLADNCKKSENGIIRLYSLLVYTCKIFVLLLNLNTFQPINVIVSESV